MPTKNTLVRAAKVRVLLTAHFNNADKFANATDVFKALEPQLTEIGTTKDATVKQLESMAANGLVMRVKEGRSALYGRLGQAHSFESAAEPAPQSSAGSKAKQTLALIESLTIADARVLYAQLKKLFG